MRGGEINNLCAAAEIPEGGLRVDYLRAMRLVIIGGGLGIFAQCTHKSFCGSNSRGKNWKITIKSKNIRRRKM